MQNILDNVNNNQPSIHNDMLVLSGTHKIRQGTRLGKNCPQKQCQKTELALYSSTRQSDSPNNVDLGPQKQTDGRVLSYDFPEFIRKVISGVQQEQILNILITKTPLMTSPQFESYRSDLKSEPQCNPIPNPRGFKLFLNPESVTFKQIMFVISQNILDDGGVQSITLRTSRGEILAQAQGYGLDQLPQEVLNVLSRVADSIVVENLCEKTFTSFDSIPQFLQGKQPFVWFERIPGDLKVEIPKSDQSIDFGLTLIQMGQYKVIYRSGQGFGETVEQIHSKLLSLKNLQSRFLTALNSQCPKLQESSCFYLQSLLFNCLLVGQVDFQKRSIHIYPVLHAVASLLLQNRVVETQNGDLMYKHFPDILKYPKFCLVCKKDNKIGFPGPKKCQVKKTKYYCQACTCFFKTQIRLCVLCFKKFHLNLNFYMAKTPEHFKTLVLPPPYTNRLQLDGSWKHQDGFTGRSSTSTLETRSVLQLLTETVKTLESARQKMSFKAGFILS